jgi:hypothetical protein
MFRSDFKEGKFPISKRSPVIGINNGDLVIAYNNKNLKEIASIKGIKLFGIWPGKINTDLFILIPEYYKDLPVPPENHRDIDLAESISIVYESDGTFDHVNYLLNGTSIICKDPVLVDYIEKIGIRYTVFKKEVPLVSDC